MYTSNKLEPKSSLCLFLGYSLHQNSYLCLDNKTHKIFTSHHVRFFETQFPFSHSNSISDFSSSSLSWSLLSYSFPLAFLSLPIMVHQALVRDLTVALLCSLPRFSIESTPTLSAGSGTSISFSFSLPSLGYLSPISPYVSTTSPLVPLPSQTDPSFLDFALTRILK